MKIQCNSFERLVNKKKKNEKIVFPKIFFTETFLRFVLTRVASYMHRSEVIVNDKETLTSSFPLEQHHHFFTSSSLHCYFIGLDDSSQQRVVGALTIPVLRLVIG